MSLKKYKSKRNFTKTNEPFPKLHKKKGKALRFVVQEHAARRLHYDFRLEVEGVLKSWAVPKGPSLDPGVKRLAVMVEDHPYDYQYFEGIIPEGYGAGEVKIWDKGTYDVDASPDSEFLMKKGIEKGEVHFTLYGDKLRGDFSLIKLRNSSKENEWLLIKKKEVLKEEKPHLIKPMLATLVDAPFDGGEWLFEIKWDGYRAISEVNRSKVHVYSRNFNSFDQTFPHIVEALKQLNIEAIFDGEIIFLNEFGKPSFQSLQNSLKDNRVTHSIVYMVFDLLYLNGKDLRQLPLIERKLLLAEVIKSVKETLFYCDHIEDKGKAFFKECLKNNLEGMIAKKKQSTYLEGKRSREWLKIKTHLRQEAIICGFTEPKGTRKKIGALLLGVYENKHLRFIGHVGGGFTDKQLSDLEELLNPLHIKECPFEKQPPTNTPVTWVKPQFLCEVSFSEWTDQGIMRQPIFVGLREDKSPKEVIKEEKKETKSLVKKVSNKVQLTHLEKIYWPHEKITKGDLISYYKEVAPFILPYLKNRPESLSRYPDGIEGIHFFQKNLEDHPTWVQTFPVEHKAKTVEYLVINNVDALLYAVNLGCIEMHPFFSQIQSLDKPDFLTFDLDPEAISFNAVIEVALAIRQCLNKFAIPSFCKTSGSTGLHLCVPLKAKYLYEEAKTFAKLVAMIVHKQLPKITSLERSPRDRQKRVYIDCLQNNPGQTLACVYSVRAKSGAPVSTPLMWEELQKGLNPKDFNLFTIPQRLKEKGDLFKPVLGKGISIEKALPKLQDYLL